MKVIPTLHPSYIQLGNWPELALLRDDLEKAQRETSTMELVRQPVQYITHPSVEQAREVLRIGDRRPLVFDIETSMETQQVICCGISREPGKAVCVPWRWPYTGLLRSAFMDASSLKAGHNSTFFDLPRIERALQLKLPVLSGFDTMLAHAVCEPDLMHGLAKIAMSNGWDGLPWKEGMSGDLQLYNCRDVDATHRAMLSLQRKVEEWGLKSTLARVMAAAPAVRAMHERGIGVDLEAQERAKAAVAARIYEAQLEVWELVGQLPARAQRQLELEIEAAKLLDRAETLWVPGTKREAGKLRTQAKRLREQVTRLREPNLASNKQLCQLFYEELELPEQRSHTGSLTVDEDALVELVRRASGGKHAHALPALLALQAYREADALGKYVTHTERIVHPSWLLHATATGRLACRDPNMQNIPQRDPESAKLIRPVFVPVGPGNELSCFDYSQIERRLQAVMSKDPDLLRIFEQGGDVHREMAALALTVARGAKVTASEVTDQERYLFKRAVYLEGYGGGWKKLQLVLAREGVSITVAQAQEIMTLIKEATPRYNQYREELLEEANGHRMLRNPFGRLRWFLGPSFGDALNFPFQSSAADCMLRAMVDLHNLLPSGCYLVAQIHDALMVEHPPSMRAEVRETAKLVMEMRFAELGGWWCPVDAKHGKTWLLEEKS